MSLVAVGPAQEFLIERLNFGILVALAQGLPGGYYTSKYSGEEIDALLDKVKEMTTGEGTT